VLGQVDIWHDAEFIVVDNNSVPPLRDRPEFEGIPMLRIVQESTPGLTAAREAAITSSTAELLVFVDDDNVLAPDYVKNAIREFSAHPELGLLGGCVVPQYESTPPEWFSEYEDWLAIRRYTDDFETETTSPPWTRFFPVGAGMAVPRSLALEYVADCEQSARIQGRRAGELSSGEDIDLALFVLSKGKTLRVTGSLRLTHLIPESRIQPEYLGRLASANASSALEIQRKWKPRLGMAVFLDYERPLPSIIVRFLVTSMLGVWSIKYRIKCQVHARLIRDRLRTGGR
jgi:glycosyltransferase involved in cell wall biosynthesis